MPILPLWMMELEIWSTRLVNLILETQVCLIFIAKFELLIDFNKSFSLDAFIQPNFIQFFTLIAWMLAATALVLLMTMPGLAIYYSGMVRDKNVLACKSN
jgi:hypothetical protein